MEWIRDVLDWFATVPSWMDPAEWSATAAWVAILLGAVAAIFAFVQIRDARRVRREVAAPYVIAFFDRSEAHMTLVDFVVRNVGQTAAHDIRLEITPPMERQKVIGAYPFMEAKAIKHGIKMLVPGQELRLYFDDASERRGPDVVREYLVRIAATDSRGKVWRSTFDLESEANQGGVQTEIHGLHWMGHRLKSMESSLKEISQAIRKPSPSSSSDLPHLGVQVAQGTLAPAPKPSGSVRVPPSRPSSESRKNPSPDS